MPGASFAEALGMISPVKPKKKSGTSYHQSPNSDVSIYRSDIQKVIQYIV